MLNDAGKFALIIVLLSASLAIADKRIVESDLQGAMRAARAGDTLIVINKTWSSAENVWIKSGQAAGTESKPITVMGSPGTKPILNGGFRIDTDYWRLTNLHFRNGASVDFKISNGAEIYNCSFIGSGYAYGAIQVGPDIKDIVLEGNYIEIENERDLHHGIYVHAADNVIVRNNIIRSFGHNGLKGYGIHIFDENKGKGIDREAHNYLIEGNTVYGTGRAGIIVAYAGDGAELYDVVVRNNLVFNCNAGIRIKNHVHHVKVYNNTIFDMVGDSPIGIHLRRVETDIEIKNNIVYTDNGAHIELQLPESPILDIENNLYYPSAELVDVDDKNPIVSDPLFLSTDLDSFDFRLMPSSPAIDVGIDLGQSFVGSAPDLGAFEFGEVTTDVKKKDLNSGPVRFSLHQNYPNPFNPHTMIDYEVSEPAQVSIAVFCLSGRKVKTLVNKLLDAGSYSVQWNGRNYQGLPVASGVYFYRIEVSGRTSSFVMRETRKMTLLQ